LLCCAALCEN